MSCSTYFAAIVLGSAFLWFALLPSQIYNIRRRLGLLTSAEYLVEEKLSKVLDACYNSTIWKKGFLTNQIRGVIEYDGEKKLVSIEDWGEYYLLNDLKIPHYYGKRIYQHARSYLDAEKMRAKINKDTLGIYR